MGNITDKMSDNKEQTTKLCAGCRAVRFVVDVGHRGNLYCEDCDKKTRKRPSEGKGERG